MSRSLSSFQSIITRGLLVVVIIPLVVITAILGLVRPQLIDSVTGEYLERLGEFVNGDIRYVLLVRDPESIRSYVEKILEFPWVHHAALYEGQTLLTQSGAGRNWQGEATVLLTSDAVVHVSEDQVHLVQSIPLGVGTADDSDAWIQITILDTAISGVIDGVLYPLIAGLGLVSLWLFGAASVFARHSSREVTRLSREMKRVDPEAGRLRRVSIDTRVQELEDVQQSFNALVSRVEQYNDELEARIAQRTQELALALEQKEKAEAVRASLIMNLSHDLRTPLTANLGYLDLALEEISGHAPDSAKLQHVLTSARSRAETLSHEVDTLLSFSISEEDLKHLVCRRTNIKRLMEETLEETRHHREDADNTLRFEFHGRTHMCTVERLMRHIVLQLLTNANRYCKSGRIEVVCVVNEVFQLTVTDNGRGIPEEERERIFDPHFRSSRLAPGPKGLGIGLSMAKNWTDYLNGSIRLIPESGRTVFVVSIPESETA